jgi:CRP-like cAMP-binding protein
LIIENKHKLNENQVLDLLNDSLRDDVVANLNGRVINECQVFNLFDFIFVSEITFQLVRTLFVMNDTVFEEGDDGNKMYFVGKGTVVLLHLKTRTYIKQLGENESFGQAAFFSNQPRSCTVRSSTFTEMLVLDIFKFHQVVSKYENDELIFNQINEKINKEKDYSDIRILCYV